MPVEVVTVNRWWRRDAATPGSVARRGRRALLAAPSCRGDSGMEARSDGNGAATASTETVAARVSVYGLDRSRERGNPRQRGRGARGASYPRARRLGRDGIVVGRGWSDRLGRYRREVGDDRDSFARSPLESSLGFAGRSFSLLFSVFFYFFSVFDLNGQAIELQIL